MWMEALTKLPLHDSIAEWEKFRISQALQESDGNKAEAALDSAFTGAARPYTHRRQVVRFA
jgi:hypothetical protein